MKKPIGLILLSIILCLSSLLYVFISPYSCYSLIDKPFNKIFSISNICRKDTVIINTKGQLKEFLANIEDYKYTKKLSIKNLEIDSVPIEIAALTHLEYLDLGYNNITTFPGFLQDLPNLKVLYIHQQNNNLKNFPTHVNGFNNLMALELGNNSLESIPDFIYELDGLRYLNFESNSITNIPEKINKLEKLQFLNILDNPIKSLELENNVKYIIIDKDKMNLLSKNSLEEGQTNIYNYNQDFNINAFIY